MASGGGSGRRSIKSISDSSDSKASILTRFTESPIAQKAQDAASDLTYAGKKLLKSTGKAAWIAGTTALVLLLPLIIELERDSMFEQLELQASLLGTSPPPPPSRS